MTDTAAVLRGFHHVVVRMDSSSRECYVVH